MHVGGKMWVRMMWPSVPTYIRFFLLGVFLPTYLHTYLHTLPTYIPYVYAVPTYIVLRYDTATYSWCLTRNPTSWGFISGLINNPLMISYKNHTPPWNMNHEPFGLTTCVLSLCYNTMYPRHDSVVQQNVFYIREHACVYTPWQLRRNPVWRTLTPQGSSLTVTLRG